MKRIFLIRHAKAVKDFFNVSDFERDLAERGIEESPKMAKLLKKHLKKEEIKESHVFIASSANRTKQTAKAFAKVLDVDKIQFKDELYLASEFQILDSVLTLDSKAQNLFIFGHNPGISGAVNLLSGESITMPTCGIALIEFDYAEHFREISKQAGTLKNYWFPKKDLV
ncbi:MAG: SixA phosphatase family protein [Luteibaculaceae bacterium]